MRGRGTAREQTRSPGACGAGCSAAQRAQRRSPFVTQAFALTVLGSVTFVPGAFSSSAPRSVRPAQSLHLGAGFYYTRLALYAYKGYAGYSFEDIPEVD